MSTEATQDLSRRALLLIGASAAVTTCGAEVNGSEVDADVTGDAAIDTGIEDAARADASVTDTTAVDSVRPDVSVTDVARVDSGVIDAARRDVPPLDTGVVDVPRVDVPVDMGAPDTGVPCTPPAAAVRIGPITSFAIGRWVAVTSQSTIIGRDARGIFAYTSVCPHRSCALPAPASATATSRCPCHSAIFTSDGAVVSGPTTTSLRNYPVIVCNGNVYVDKTRSVAMGTRTPVP